MFDNCDQLTGPTGVGYAQGQGSAAWIATSSGLSQVTTSVDVSDKVEGTGSVAAIITQSQDYTSLLTGTGTYYGAFDNNVLLGLYVKIGSAGTVILYMWDLNNNVFSYNLNSTVGIWTQNVVDLRQSNEGVVNVPTARFHLIDLHFKSTIYPVTNSYLKIDKLEVGNTYSSISNPTPTAYPTASPTPTPFGATPTPSASPTPTPFGATPTPSQTIAPTSTPGYNFTVNLSLAPLQIIGIVIIFAGSLLFVKGKKVEA